jgi:methionine-S-sulfoxide reductase
MKNSLTRLEYLVGELAIMRLKNATVAVVGIGGVGSVAAEVLARSGVGTLILVDRDIVEMTNINRQLVADTLTIGLKKVDVMRQKVKNINPTIQVITYDDVYSETNHQFLFSHKIDYLIDAIDSIADKYHLIKMCIINHLKFISAMGAANKLNPSLMKVTELSKTDHDPIAKILRRKMREDGLQAKVNVISSDELVIHNKKAMVGSYMAVTATSGILAANEAIKELTKSKEIILAGGCFWGVERYYKQLSGVLDTEVGYTDGTQENPTYQELCAGKADHVEACKIVYDDSIITLVDLLEHLFRFIDPTTLNRQGGDIGIQYRTGVYYTLPEEKKVIEDFLAEMQKHYKKPIVVEVKPKSAFYPAEDYHQNYLDKNPKGYCHVDFGLIKDTEKK